MQTKNLTNNKNLISLVLSFLILGFLSIGSATAGTVNERSGSWTQKQKAIAGGWSVEQRGDQQVISFDGNFKTKGGPDLKIFLSPTSIDSVNGKTATDGSVLVSALQTTKGSQEYVLPAGVDINDYRSLLIHCEQYSVLWGGFSL